jgi:hypothetical protein
VRLRVHGSGASSDSISTASLPTLPTLLQPTSGPRTAWKRLAIGWSSVGTITKLAPTLRSVPRRTHRITKPQKDRDDRLLSYGPIHLQTLTSHDDRDLPYRCGRQPRGKSSNASTGLRGRHTRPRRVVCGGAEARHRTFCGASTTTHDHAAAGSEEKNMLTSVGDTHSPSLLKARLCRPSMLSHRIAITRASMNATKHLEEGLANLAATVCLPTMHQLAPNPIPDGPQSAMSASPPM